MATPSRTCYIVAFEVSAATIREALRQRLKAYQYYCPINTNCWAILSDQSAAQVRDNLMEVMEPNDKIFVVRSGSAAAWRNAYGDDNNAWLKKYL